MIIFVPVVGDTEHKKLSTAVGTNLHIKLNAMLKPIFGDQDWIGYNDALGALNRQLKANSKNGRITKAMLADITHLQSRVDYYAKKLENKGKAI